MVKKKKPGRYPKLTKREKEIVQLSINLAIEDFIGGKEYMLMAWKKTKDEHYYNNFTYYRSAIGGVKYLADKLKIKIDGV